MINQPTDLDLKNCPDQMVRAILSALVVILLLVAVSLHSPPQMSLDSTTQLYEAHTGRLVSWAPPFMSAYLRALGGDLTAARMFTYVNMLLLGLGLLLALHAYPRQKSIIGAYKGWYGYAAAIPLAFILLNPVIYLYSGIVWKDVLFAAMACASLGSLFHAVKDRKTSIPLLLFSSLIILPGPLVRQQAIVVTPVLVVLSSYLLAGELVQRFFKPSNQAKTLGQRRHFGGVLAVSVFLVAAQLALFAGLDKSIRSSMPGMAGADTSVGVRGLMSYDIAGFIVRGKLTNDLPLTYATKPFQNAVRASYDDERIDTVMANAVAARGFGRASDNALHETWWSLVSTYPLTFARIKLERFAWLASLRELNKCLPIHVGISGIPEHVSGAGLEMSVSQSSKNVFGIYSFFRNTGWFRHWVYPVLLLVMGCVAFFYRKLWDRQQRLVLSAALTSTFGFYALFILTGIACDFRYLFPGLVMSSVVLIYISSALLRHPSRQ